MLPGGSKRLLKYDVAPPAPLQVKAAIFTLGGNTVGQALNVTGNIDPVCAMPSTIGIQSGGLVITPGGGNVRGSPAATAQNVPFPYSIPALINTLRRGASAIDAPGTGVFAGTGIFAGTFSSKYNGVQAVALGVPPTVNPSTGPIISISAPGTPVTYYSPGDLTLGTPTINSAYPVNGQGMLLVQGNLTIDITNGFNYFGLILVTGNVTMTANPSTSASSNIHGSIFAGGTFTASALANLSGSIFIHQNACMVTNQFYGLPLQILAFRELSQ